MAIAKKLGKKYEDVRVAARYKTIKVDLNDVSFELKVRVPVKREMEEMLAKITTPDPKAVTEIFDRLSKPLRESVAENGAEFLETLNSDGDRLKITDDDVIVNGTSIKQVSNLAAIWQTQVTSYFSLLQSETGEPINESYDEIAEEFPDAVIKEIITKIDEAIRPSYKETKKN